MYIICEKEYLNAFKCPLCGGFSEVEWEGSEEELFALSRCSVCGASGARYSINMFGVDDAEYYASCYWDSDEWYEHEVLEGNVTLHEKNND